MCAFVWELVFSLLPYFLPYRRRCAAVAVLPCHLYHSDVFIVDDVSDEVSIPICRDGSVVVDDGCDIQPFGGVALASGLVVASGELDGVDAFDYDVGFFRCGEAFD